MNNFAFVSCKSVADLRGMLGRMPPPPRFNFFHFIHFYRPQTKLWKGNVFISMCQEFCLWGEVYTPRQIPSPGIHPLADTPWQTPPTPPGRHPLADTPPSWQTHPLWADTPGQTPLADTPPRYGHCSGLFASYWNAFLLAKTFTN